MLLLLMIGFPFIAKQMYSPGIIIKIPAEAQYRTGFQDAQAGIPGGHLLTIKRSPLKGLNINFITCCYWYCALVGPDILISASRKAVCF
ncbi:hypothetical protein A8C56_12870 [Niabella ginsenosidivorans]|uniref:Uncharacterized protein n=1 Tax=Niabella ginsenosidivorans TaxID=1176587 RepID=A0A1A9I5C2_9BACT|nr:hypothetical protein A8C56_12870 [Niabella ginsenosidivorans]